MNSDCANPSTPSPSKNISIQAQTFFSQLDHQFMRQALDLAQQGLYSTSPNPRVGCVIVKQGQVIGQGYHLQAGGSHAEVYALDQANKNALGTKGATVYVTLEPCCHHGRTPPCTDALIAAQVKAVIAACTDPNPLVAGHGLKKLQAAGIQVQHGLLEKEATELNIGFFKRMQYGTPWVRLKTAIGLDGLIALPNGQSQWITGEQARADGHAWRARACAILTGIGTITTDNPLLNVRHLSTPRQPIRIVLDSQLRIDTSYRIITSANQAAPVWIVHTVDELKHFNTNSALSQKINSSQLNDSPLNKTYEKAILLKKAGVELVYCPNSMGKINLAYLMLELGNRGINELHVEAGATLNSSLLKANSVDELLIYQAPLILGQGKPFAVLPESKHINEISPWYCLEHHRLEEDWRLRLRKTIS